MLFKTKKVKVKNQKKIFGRYKYEKVQHPEYIKNSYNFMKKIIEIFNEQIILTDTAQKDI